MENLQISWIIPNDPGTLDIWGEELNAKLTELVNYVNNVKAKAMNTETNATAIESINTQLAAINQNITSINSQIGAITTMQSQINDINTILAVMTTAPSVPSGLRGSNKAGIINLRCQSQPLTTFHFYGDTYIDGDTVPIIDENDYLGSSGNGVLAIHNLNIPASESQVKFIFKVKAEKLGQETALSSAYTFNLRFVTSILTQPEAIQLRDMVISMVKIENNTVVAK